MQTKKVNAKLLWIQFEDVLATRLGLTVWDRAVYSYLLRHSLVVGKFRLHFAVMNVARDLGLSNGPVRQAVRRLDELGALRLLERSKAGHLVEMRLPEEIPAVRPGNHGASRAAEETPASALEATDFLKTWALRKAIHDRERGICFYCLRRTPCHVQCLDHVVPRALSGRNSYRNLVSCCMECNFHKGDRPAPDHLRDLYRRGRLTAAELDARLRALQDLTEGKLAPRVSDLGNAPTEDSPKQQRPTASLHRASGWRGRHASFAGGDEAANQPSLEAPSNAHPSK